MNNHYKLTMVIPCFNENESIPEIFEQAKIVSAEGWCKFVIVDNGSLIPITHFNAVNDESIKIVRTPSNLGYGGGIQLGLLHANTPFVGWMHADLQTPVTEILKFKKHLEKNDFIKGYRKGRPYSDKFFSLGMSFLESLLFFSKFVEVNAQPTILKSELMKNAKNAPVDFSFDLYAMVLAKRGHAKFHRVDVPFFQRKFGNSSWNTGFKSRIKFIKRTLIFSISLRFKGL